MSGPRRLSVAGRRGATRRDAAFGCLAALGCSSTVARYKTRTPLSTYFLHLFSLPLLFAFAFALCLSAHAALPDAYVETTGTQYFLTDYCANPNTKAVIDFQCTTLVAGQRFFGSDYDNSNWTFSFAFRENGSHKFEWAAKDGSLNYGTIDRYLNNTSRWTFTLDSYGNAYDLRTTGAETAANAGAITTTRTKTAAYPLAIAADNRGAVPAVSPAKQKTYSFKLYSCGHLRRCYVPSWDEAKTGLVEIVSGKFLTNLWTSGSAPLAVGGTLPSDPSAYIEGDDDVRWLADEKRLDFRLAVEAGNAGGTVKLNSSSASAAVTNWYAYGDTVTFEAVEPSGCVFAGWTGGIDGLNAYQIRSSRLTLSVDGPRTLVATYRVPGTKYWRGRSSTSAKAATNWCDSAALDAPSSSTPPQWGDHVVLDGADDNAQRVLLWDLDDITPGSWTQDGYTNAVTLQTGFIGRKYGWESKVQTTYGQLTADGSRRMFSILGDAKILSGSWRGTQHGNDFKAYHDAWADGRGIYRMEIEVGGNLTVGAEAKIDASLCGFYGSNGPGRYQVGNGNGASHGGSGRPRSDYTGPCYGSVKNPETIGSACGGRGGGCILLKVSGAMRHEGVLDASATPSTSWDGSAGGSISVRAASLAGAGAMYANGTSVTEWGGGGGGRIAISVTATNDLSAYTGEVTAYGGHTDSRQDAHCGTIYLETTADAGCGTLVLKGRGTLFHGDLTIGTMLNGYLADTSDYEFGRIVMTNGVSLGVTTNATLKVHEIVGLGAGSDDMITLHGGTLHWPDGYALTNATVRTRQCDTSRILFYGTSGETPGTMVVVTNGQIEGQKQLTVEGNLHLRPGGLATHTRNSNSDAGFRLNLEVTGDMTIDAGASVDVSGKGLSREATVGANGSGSAHAGVGTQGGTKTCYGSVKCPTTLGGKGGSYTPYSGGAMHIAIGGTLRNAGHIRATGGDGWVTAASATSGQECGGGGSVWISAARLLGDGDINANGQVARFTNGTGGGGRVALYLTDAEARFSDYTGKITAYGGYSTWYSRRFGAGTVYYHLADEAEDGGTLVIDGGMTNGTACYSTTEFTERVTDTSFDTVIITNGASVKQYQNTTITVRRDWLNYGAYASEVADTENAAGAVVFTNAAAVSHLVGANTFAEFTCATPGKRLLFAPGSANAITIMSGGKFAMTGGEAADDRITLAPDGSGSWTLDILADAKTDLAHLVVSGSDASTSTIAPVASQSQDAGENQNWTFVNIVPGETITWCGGTGTGWAQPANWDRARTPVDTDRIVIAGDAATMPALVEAITVNTLVIESGATLSLGEYDLTVTNALSVSGRLVASATEHISVGGALTLSAGSFARAKTTLELTGGASATANFGNNALWNLVFSREGATTSVTGGFTADTVRVTATTSETTLAFGGGVNAAAREWHVDGGSDSAHVRLVSLAQGSAWTFTVTGLAYVWGAQVRDSTAGGLAVFAESPSVDLGGNTGWTFNVVRKTWTGGTSTAFDAAENWSPSGVPDGTARVIFEDGANVVLPAEGATVRSVTVKGRVSVSGGPFTVTGAYDVDCATQTLDAVTTVGGSMSVRNGGNVTHTANAKEEGHRVDITVGGDLTVDAGASIDAYAVGFATGYGPGKGSYYNKPGSHGGCGSDGACYGSVREPNTSGSTNGGGGYGGYGGGIVHLTVRGTATVNGAIGATAEKCGWYSSAGGSVLLRAGRLEGSGSVSARGGYVTAGGAGGGGRVAVYLTEKGAAFSDFGGTIDAFGGMASGDAWSGAGTVYLSTAGTPPNGGTIVIAGSEASNYRGNWTEFPVSGEEDVKQYARATLDIGTKGKVRMRGDIRVGECELDATSTLNLNGQALTIHSRRHHDNTKFDALGNYKGDWPGTVDYSVENSTIKWHRPGAVIIVR